MSKPVRITFQPNELVTLNAILHDRRRELTSQIQSTRRKQGHAQAAALEYDLVNLVMLQDKLEEAEAKTYVR